MVCVLKDTRTVVSDGREICVNLTGTDGMATGGSGDVLTGILTGLLAQGMDGSAGELASKRLGRRGMLAGDLLKEIPTVLLEGENA